MCGDNMDLVNGVPTGCVRVSFGYMSTFGDAQKFVEFVQQCFVDQSVDTHPLGGVQSVNTIPLGGVQSVNTIPLGGVQSVNTIPLGGVQSVNTIPLGGVQSVNTIPLGGVQSVNTHPSNDEWLAPEVLCDAPNVLSLPAAATCGVSLCAGDSVRPVVQQLGEVWTPLIGGQGVYDYYSNWSTLPDTKHVTSVYRNVTHVLHPCTQVMVCPLLLLLSLLLLLWREYSSTRSRAVLPMKYVPLSISLPSSHVMSTVCVCSG